MRLLSLWIIIILSLSSLSEPLQARKKVTPLMQRRANLYLQRAKESFAKRKYDRAAYFYRKHIRIFRKNFDAWNQLAATYYHMGQPNKALRLLRRFEKKTPIKSYNQFYQGMSLLSLEHRSRAKALLTRAAGYTDKYAAKATYELAITEYRNRNKSSALYWINLYKQRYPRGPHLKTIFLMEQTLANGAYVSDLKGNPRPNMEKALYRYHPLSLTRQPNFWFIRSGWESNFGTQQDPDLDGATGLKPSEFVNHAFKLHSGVGLGPITVNSSTSWVGYNYKQDWLTDNDRFNEFLGGDPTDPIDYFRYFPLRPDLLERTHELYGDVRYLINEYFFLGIYGQQNYRFIGSSLIPQEDPVQQKSTRVSETSLLIPQFGANYADYYQTLFYFYFRKEIDEEAPDFSNKTYSLLDEGEPVISLGISHRMSFPEERINVNVELFQYEFIFNDYWQDYTRSGLILGGEYSFYRGIWVQALLGYYEDRYQLPVFRQESCQFKKAEDTQTAQAPENCQRVDTGTIYQVGAYWDLSRFDRVGLTFRNVENLNPDLKVYDRSTNTILAWYTFAFPSVRNVLRFVERFGDVAFTKEPE